MRALSLVAIGLALAAVDFRTDAFDVLPDPLGWALVAVGAYRLSMRLAACGAAVAAILSVSEAYLPFRYVRVDPVTMEAAPGCAGCPEQLRYDEMSQIRAVATALAVVVGSAAIMRILHRLRTHVGPTRDCPGLHRHMRILEVLAPVTWVLPIAILVGRAIGTGKNYDPVWNGPLEGVGLVTSVVLVWTVATIARFSNSYPTPFADVQPRARQVTPPTT